MTYIKSATNSLKVFGIYMMLIPGIGLMTIPNFVLDLNGLSHDKHLWTARVVGLLAFIIGTYQFSIAKYELQRLYKITVAQRYFASLFFVILYLTGEAEVAILLFALIDFIGATWTMLTTTKMLPTKS
ncbi:hypothetical protein [Empedobacter brevis]|uniref:hypothetical protein n=1 Tax=Empedobacter brevis TaxID=247 RepID=UPI0028A60959|nr:hypothetical protein [Empedobacter brevis]